MDRHSGRLTAPMAIAGIPLLMVIWEPMESNTTKIHIRLFHPLHIKAELQVMLLTIISRLLLAHKQLVVNGCK